MLKSVLLYHVPCPELPRPQPQQTTWVADSVQGAPLRINLRSRPSGVTVNGVEVVKPDIKASNGIVHVVDQVLLAPQADIVDTLVGDDRFSTLVAAVTAAGLVDTLKGETDAYLPIYQMNLHLYFWTPCKKVVRKRQPLHRLRPPNDAFAKLPPGTVDSLLQDVPALTEVLLRHVVPSTLYSRALVGNSFSTAGGDRVRRRWVCVWVFIALCLCPAGLCQNKGGVSVATKQNSAGVVEADKTVTNGVVHVIDSVI
nr:uncharacterized protein LOC113817575 [Penaeus vannamei]